MADANVGDIYLATMRGSLLGQEVLSTFTYRIATLGTDLPLVDSVYSDLNTALSAPGGIFGLARQCMPANYNHFATRIQRIATSRIRATEFAGTGLGARAVATSANFASVISRYGEVAKRYAQSTLHLPHSGQSSDVSAGSITGTLVTALEDLAAALPAAILPNGANGYLLTPVIFNRTRVPNFSDIRGAYVQTTSRVMRRRTVGLGI